MVAQGTGYQDMDSDLAQLATHILLIASTRTMRQEFFAGLQILIDAVESSKFIMINQNNPMVKECRDNEVK